MTEGQKTLKVLVVADLEGKLAKMHDKVRLLATKSNNFDALFCIGKFFGDGKELEPYISGEKNSPIPTYFITKSDEHIFLPPSMPSTGHICDNIVYLGRCGLREILGLSVAFFSGVISPEQARKSNSAPDVDEELVSALKSRSQQALFHGADLFLTNHWSQGVLNHLKDVNVIGLPTLQIETFGSSDVSELALCLTPRYHFAASPTHLSFERAVYANEDMTNKSMLTKLSTRFIALAEAFNTRSSKFMYAFNIIPLKTASKEVLYQIPAGVTACPFTSAAQPENLSIINSARKRKFEEMEKEDQKMGTNQAFFDPQRAQRGQEYHERKQMHKERIQSDQRRHQGERTMDHDRQRNDYRNRRRLDRNDPKLMKQIHPLMQRAGCWFCLSNPAVEEHLVVSVGDHNYLAMAKGGLNSRHLLVIPIVHTPSLDLVTDSSAQNEMQRFKDALIKCYSEKGLALMFWERKLLSDGPSNTADKFHGHTQALVVQKEVISKIQQRFESEFKYFGLKMEKLEDNQSLSQIVGKSSYLYLEMPSSESNEPSSSTESAESNAMKKDCYSKSVVLIPEGKRVPVQLPRRVVARALDQPEKEDWKNCALSKEQEDKACADVKEEFGPFDFTLADA